MDSTAACPSILLAIVLVAESVDRPGDLLTATAIGTGYSVLSALTFAAFQVEAPIWQYFAHSDLVRLAMASVTVSAIGGVIMGTAGGFGATAVALAIVQLLLSLSFLLAFRLLWRCLAGVQADAPEPVAERLPILLMDLGVECSQFLRRYRGVSSPMLPIGIVADEQVGRSVSGVPVVGGLDDLERIVSRFDAIGQRPRHLVLTREVSVARARKLRGEAERLGLAVRELSTLADPLSPPKGSTAVEPVTLSDLRGPGQRAPIDITGLARSMAGRRLLVTGAGGSIGSELVRLLAGLEPSSIALLDNCEYNLYAIDRELSERFPSVPRIARVADVRDPARLELVFSEFRPEIVFHGAALKHVPMVEANVCEGIRTNVVGSRNVSEAALRAGALAMVQISTDKAVNPVNVMGASKRLAEIYCQALDVAVGGGEIAAPQPTRFMTVRFGNVWGSSGSVVPLFEQQIARGGPITVTHPEIERYFMTIREACELVVHAATGGLRTEAERGLVYVLDMGAPLRIADVARQLVCLHGKRPDDVRIEFVGLRPGEKLYEELFDSEEVRIAGPDAGILAARSAPRSFEEVSAIVGLMGGLAQDGNDALAREVLAMIIPPRGDIRERDGQAAA